MGSIFPQAPTSSALFRALEVEGAVRRVGGCARVRRRCAQVGGHSPRTPTRMPRTKAQSATRPPGRAVPSPTQRQAAASAARTRASKQAQRSMRYRSALRRGLPRSEDARGAARRARTEELTALNTPRRGVSPLAQHGVRTHLQPGLATHAGATLRRTRLALPRRRPKCRRPRRAAAPATLRRRRGRSRRAAPGATRSLWRTAPTSGGTSKGWGDRGVPNSTQVDPWGLSGWPVVGKSSRGSSRRGAEKRT